MFRKKSRVTTLKATIGVVLGAFFGTTSTNAAVVVNAVETGGNVEGSELNKVVEVDGVKVVGFANLPGLVPLTASQMYSSNLGNFIDHFWDKEGKIFNLKLEDDLIKGALITHDGELFSETYKSIMNK